jgi:hypothetical protein
MAKNARHPKTQAAPRGRILTYPKEKMDQGMGSLTRRRGISFVQFDTRSQMKIMAQRIQFILLCASERNRDIRVSERKSDTQLGRQICCSRF